MNASLVAPATVISNAGLVVAAVKPPEVAVKTLSVPTRSMLIPENVATPAMAATSVVPLSVPLPVVSASVTLSVAEVTVFPLASWIVTTGC